jgi:Zn ribbon nucleic-acid-binding protein
MIRRLFFSVLFFFSTVSIAGPWVYVSKPMYRGDRLDWCANFAADCGQPAVDAYCKYLGYKTTPYFAIDPDIGRTRLITGAVCEDSYCDGFQYLYCRKYSEVVNLPKAPGYNDRLDWCKDFAANCGKPAADEYCKSQGWARSYSYAIDEDIGRTRLITGAVCEDSFCDGFKYIGCSD